MRAVGCGLLAVSCCWWCGLLPLLLATDCCRSVLVSVGRCCWRLWVVVVGCCRLLSVVAGCLLLAAVCCWLFAVGCLSLAVGCLLFAVACRGVCGHPTLSPRWGGGDLGLGLIRCRSGGRSAVGLWSNRGRSWVVAGPIWGPNPPQRPNAPVDRSRLALSRG